MADAFPDKSLNPFWGVPGHTGATSVGHDGSSLGPPGRASDARPSASCATKTGESPSLPHRGPPKTTGPPSCLDPPSKS